MTDDAPDPREAVLELLLDSGHDPVRREELRALVERDPTAMMELRELERIDDLLRTAGPMLEPSDDLAARVLMIPDQEHPVAAEAPDVPWDLSLAAEPEQRSYEDDLEGAIAPPPPDGPTLLADLMPPPRPRRSERRTRERGGFWRNVVVWRAATVACAAAALVLGVMAFGDDEDEGGEREAAAATTVTVPAETTVAGATIPVRFAQGERGTGSLVADPAGEAGRRVHIVIEGLALTPRRVYTVWIARAAQQRIPLGSFKQDADGNLDITVTIPPGLPPAYRGIWVTREPQSGKKGWSNDWVIRAPLS